MKLKKGIPVIDQGDKLGFWGGKFGGNFVPETLKKPIEDLEILRLLELGCEVKMIKVSSSSVAVDTPKDLEKVRAMIHD